MAWVAANTTALTVDGNYHSARRLPELIEQSDFDPVIDVRLDKREVYEGLGDGWSRTVLFP